MLRERIGEVRWRVDRDGDGGGEFKCGLCLIRSDLI